MDKLLMMMDGWGVFSQILFLLFLSGVIGIITMTLLSEISKFFNSTLPILFRGWPPEYIHEESTDENEDEDNIGKD